MTGKRRGRVAGNAAAATAICLGAVMLLSTAVVLSSRVRQFLGISVGPKGYALGERVDVPRAMYAKTAGTLIVFGKDGCQACEASKPELIRLVAELKRNPSTNVVVIGPEGPVATAANFSKAIGIDNSQTFQLKETAVRAVVVPTLLLVDGAGRIAFVHQGIVRASTVTDVLARVTDIVRR